MYSLTFLRTHPDGSVPSLQAITHPKLCVLYSIALALRAQGYRCRLWLPGSRLYPFWSARPR